MHVSQLAAPVDLPECFRCHCDCGWAGLLAKGVVYVVGVNCLVEDESMQCLRRCPQCVKDVTHASLTVADLRERFAWMCQRLGNIHGRGTDAFPCTCEHRPPCNLVRGIELRAALADDSCFVSDAGWIRAAGMVKCNGCHAEGKIALLERHSSRDVDAVFTVERSNILKPRILASEGG